MSVHNIPAVVDERTALFNIVQQRLPRAAKSLIENSPSRRISSKLQQDDYDDIRSHLLKVKVVPQTAATTPIRPSKTGQAPSTAAPATSPRRSRRRTSPAGDVFDSSQRFSKHILKDKRISTTNSKFIPAPVRDFLTAHVNRLIQPMHDTISLKIQRDSLNAKSNISRALGRYAINKEYYHRMYYEDESKINPQIREFLDKKRAILEKNARTIDASDFYRNTRLFKQLEEPAEEKQPQNSSEEYRQFCQRILDYAKEEPPRRCQSNVDVRRTKLPFNVDLKEFQIETRALERLMREKKSSMTRVNIHQRNLNRDEKKLRTVVNLADYVGYT